MWSVCDGQPANGNAVEDSGAFSDARKTSSETVNAAVVRIPVRLLRSVATHASESLESLPSYEKHSASASQRQNISQYTDTATTITSLFIHRVCLCGLLLSNGTGARDVVICTDEVAVFFWVCFVASLSIGHWRVANPSRMEDDSYDSLS